MIGAARVWIEMPFQWRSWGTPRHPRPRISKVLESKPSFPSGRNADTESMSLNGSVRKVRGKERPPWRPGRGQRTGRRNWKWRWDVEDFVWRRCPGWQNCGSGFPDRKCSRQVLLLLDLSEWKDQRLSTCLRLVWWKCGSVVAPKLGERVVSNIFSEVQFFSVYCYKPIKTLSRRNHNN